MVIRILSIIVISLLTPGQPFSFPVFGTKRYHRASNTALLPQSSTSLVSSNPVVPYYNSMSQYYDEQPPYVQPNYQYEPHLNNDAYYYQPPSSSYSKPRHEYLTYGMPTYHGEYKPSPYYYAPGPSYSYYDDREIANNPLDDLHEEMMQEDERERQREMFPIIGQESWYGNSRKQDAYTKNFLRNLIEYNREIEAQQQQIQREQENEYDDYMEMNPSEYDYEQTNESPYDLLSKYEKQQQSETDSADDMEDENVRQLKLLANSKQQQQKSTKNNDKNLNHKNINSHKENNFQESFSNWQQPSSSSASFNQYDTEPEYEEEDDWINWDRKRSDKQMKNSLLPSEESIKAFSNRKPSSVVVEKSTKKPPSASALSSSSATTTTTTTTTTPKTTKLTINGKFSGQKEVVLPRPATPAQHLFSQPVLDMLDKNTILAQEQQQPQQTITNNNNNNNQRESYASGANVIQTNSDATTTTENKRSKDSIKSNANIYDTIKQLIAMGEQLEKNSLESKLKKRFVSNEENLVHELDNLKRRSL